MEFYLCTRYVVKQEMAMRRMVSMRRMISMRRMVMFNHAWVRAAIPAGKKL